MAKILIPLADGFEEIEAITLIDVLKRAENNVVVAGLTSKEVQGSYAKLTVKTDCLLSEVETSQFDMVVLPGGMPGSKNLAENPLMQSILQDFNNRNKKIGAICAAPLALNEAGVLDGEYTCYPSCETMIKEDGYNPNQNVVINQNIFTSRGPATAICFALEIVKELQGSEKYLELKNGLLANFC